MQDDPPLPRHIHLLVQRPVLEESVDVSDDAGFGVRIQHDVLPGRVLHRLEQQPALPPELVVHVDLVVQLTRPLPHGGDELVVQRRVPLGVDLLLVQRREHVVFACSDVHAHPADLVDQVRHVLEGVAEYGKIPLVAQRALVHGHAGRRDVVHPISEEACVGVFEEGDCGEASRCEAVKVEATGVGNGQVVFGVRLADQLGETDILAAYVGGLKVRFELSVDGAFVLA